MYEMFVFLHYPVLEKELVSACTPPAYSPLWYGTIKLFKIDTAASKSIQNLASSTGSKLYLL